MDTGFTVQNPEPKKPFIKTPLGNSVLVIGGTVLLLILGFIITTGYYFIRIKTGTADEIAQRFAGEFSSDSSLQTLDKEFSISDVKNAIHPYNPTKGKSSAPITILVFEDFECPFCQKSYPIFKKAVEEFGPAVRVVFKHFPLSSIHERAIPAGIASSCAFEQKKFWEYRDDLFETNKLKDDALTKSAQKIGLNMVKFNECVKSQKNLGYTHQDLQDGLIFGVKGTPTYIINNTKIEGVVTSDQWRTLLVDQLN